MTGLVEFIVIAESVNRVHHQCDSQIWLGPFFRGPNSRVILGVTYVARTVSNLEGHRPVIGA